MTLKVVPLDLKRANEFVAQHHRHNDPTNGHKFSIGIEENGELVGVGIAGRPIARFLDNGRNLELRRICVKVGVSNGCSMLLGRLKRIAQLMGYERILTYTLQKESGASLRAIGAACVSKVGPSNWARSGRSTRHQPVYDEPKYRWELQDGAQSMPDAAAQISPKEQDPAPTGASA